MNEVLIACHLPDLSCYIVQSQTSSFQIVSFVSSIMFILYSLAFSSFVFVYTK